MTIQWWQILLLTVYAGFAFYDGNNTTFGTVSYTHLDVYKRQPP